MCSRTSETRRSTTGDSSTSRSEIGCEGGTRRTTGRSRRSSSRHRERDQLTSLILLDQLGGRIGLPERGQEFARSGAESRTTDEIGQRPLVLPVACADRCERSESTAGLLLCSERSTERARPLEECLVRSDLSDLSDRIKMVGHRDVPSPRRPTSFLT